MTFTAAVATGPEAAADLRCLLTARIESAAINWAEHNGCAVAWAADHPWVSSADDGETLVVLDGQLHNLFEQGRTQAALLLRRYRERGMDLARDLLGDFVVIVLDRKCPTVMVSRDPLGVRPWYQATFGRRHAGASDAATLCSLPWVDDSVNESEALAYLAGLAESRGPTLHRGVITLAPGSTWISSPAGFRTWRHHTWAIRPEPEVGWEEAVERCRKVTDDAVRSRVQAAGTPTSELSGGLDSTAIVGTIVEMGFDDLLVGRLLFDGPEADERSYSDLAIRHWGLRAVSAAPWRPTDDEEEEMTRAMRRPPPEPNFTMLAGLQAAFLDAGRSTGLTGLGGDDAFAAVSQASLLIGAVQQRQFRELVRLTAAGLRDPLQAWRSTWRPTLGYLSPVKRGGLPSYASHIRSEVAETHGLTARLRTPFAPLTGVRSVDNRAQGLTSGYLANILEDRALVADGDGWRSTHPFLDPRVIHATYGLNPWFTRKNRPDRALQVAALGHRMPTEVRHRQDKADFHEVLWARADVDEVRHRVLRGPLVDRGWLDREGFEKVLQDAQKERTSAALPFWRASSLDRWLRQTGD